MKNIYLDKFGKIHRIGAIYVPTYENTSILLVSWAGLVAAA